MFEVFNDFCKRHGSTFYKYIYGLSVFHLESIFYDSIDNNDKCYFWDNFWSYMET